MEKTSIEGDSTALNGDLELATWNRQRTSEELLSFIASHQSALPDTDELE